MTGSRGPAGDKGEPGERGNDYVDLVKSNWKQCVRRRIDGKDSGLIQVCEINNDEQFKKWTTLVATVKHCVTPNTTYV